MFSLISLGWSLVAKSQGGAGDTEKAKKIENWPWGGQVVTVVPLWTFRQYCSIAFIRAFGAGRPGPWNYRSGGFSFGWVSGQGLMRAQTPCAARFFRLTQFYRRRLSIPGMVLNPPLGLSARKPAARLATRYRKTASANRRVAKATLISGRRSRRRH